MVVVLVQLAVKGGLDILVMRMGDVLAGDGWSVAC